MSRAPDVPAPTGADRLGFRRHADDRIVAGVAAGLARALGVDPVLVRVSFVVLAFAGGVGVLVYALLWAVAPVGATGDHAARTPRSGQQSVAVALVVLGLLLLLRRVGLWFGDALVFPVLLAAVGSAIVWARGDEDERSRWSREATRHATNAVSAVTTRPSSPVRIVVGTLFVATGLGGFLAANEGFGALADLGLAVAATFVGMGLLLGPWLWQLSEQVRAERRERIRQEERAELAAHLHDSVLQTLALIQRSADQPRRMVALARRQERELRSWLYGQRVDPRAANLEDAVAAVAEEVEATHDVAVEVVVVGEAPVDDRVQALLAALREACVNAAKHAGGAHVTVYVEAEPDAVTAFVRDRGVGFDPDAVPRDRHGIRESIVGRLARHGGRAQVTSTVGEGTEVELAVPRPRHPSADTGPETTEEAP